MSTAVGGVLSGGGAVDEAQQQRQPSPFETSCAVSVENVSGRGGEGGGGIEVSNEEDAAAGGRPARARPAGSVPPAGCVPPGVPEGPPMAALPSAQCASLDPMAAAPHPPPAVPWPPPSQQQQPAEGEALDSGTESQDIDEGLLEADMIRARLDALWASGLLPGFEEEGRAEEAAVGVSSQSFNLLGGGSSFPSWEDYEDDDDDGGSEEFEERDSRERRLMSNRLDVMEGCLALLGVAPGG